MVVYGIIALMGVGIWMDAKVNFTRHKNLAVAGA
jgi:xanthine/uracil permease